MAALLKFGLVALVLASPSYCRQEAPTMSSGSRSIIIRATHILLVRVESAHPGAWSTRERRLRTRTVVLRLQSEKPLKGETSPDSVEISVSQNEPAIPRVFAVPSVWSGKTLESGAQYLVFAHSASRQTAEVLREASILQVVAASDALTDVQLALKSEQNHWSPSQIVSHAAHRLNSLGPLFAEYLADRLRTQRFSSLPEFERVMAFTESPGLSVRFRRVLLSAVYSDLLLSDSVPDRFASRLLVTSFRILAQQDAAALREDLIGNLMPNLVGLEGGTKKRSAVEMFRDFPADRKKAEQILTSDPPGRAARMLRWLRAGNEGAPG